MPTNDHRLSPGGVAYTPQQGVLDAEQEAAWQGQEKPSRVIPAPRQPIDVYALLGVLPDTVQAYRPRWDEGRARAWLVRHEPRLREMLTHMIGGMVRELLNETSGRALQRDREMAPTTPPVFATSASLPAGEYVIRQDSSGRFYYAHR